MRAAVLNCVPRTSRPEQVLPRFLVALVFTVAATFWQSHVSLAIGVGYFIILTLRSKCVAPIGVWAKLLPFALILSLPLALDPVQPRSVAWAAAALVLLRMSVATLAVAWSLNGATEQVVLDVLRTCRIPALLVAVIGLILRYVYVLHDEVQRVQVARQARYGGTKPWLQEMQLTANLIGIVLSRAALRSERLHLALLARGHSRLDAAPPPWMLSLHNYLYLACNLCLALIITWADAVYM